MSDKGIVNLESVCEEWFGITSRQYRTHAKRGEVPPVVNGQINIFLAFKHLLIYYRKLSEEGGSPELTKQRIRIAKATADKKELQLEREQGLIINTEIAMKLWGAVLQTIKSRIESIPVKLAPLARAASTDAESKEIIEDFIKEVLTELANPNLKEIAGMVSDKSNIKHIKTKAKVDSKPMGGQRKGTKSGK